MHSGVTPLTTRPFLCANFCEEIVDQQRDIPLALPQRRHLELDHVETVVEVFAKPAGRHLLLQIAVGGAENARIHLEGLLPPHPLQFMLLQHPQQLRLHPGRGFADLVEKERPALGLDEASLAATVRAGKRPLLMAKELGFAAGFPPGPRS